MAWFMKLSREVQIVLVGGVLYLVMSFFDWQQVSVLGITAGQSEWAGIGVVAGLASIALLLWEATRLFRIKIPLGTLSEGLVSVALALVLVLFTVITFFAHSDARHWPAWIGLLLSLAIGSAAVVRARAEGVQLPRVPSTSGPGTVGGAPH